jgi:hypothetical protein
VARVAVSWLDRVKRAWADMLPDLGTVAENIAKVFGVTSISTDVAATGPTFLVRLMAHLGALEEGAPLLKAALGRIKSLWASAEAMAEDAGLSETLKRFYSILDLSKTFEELQVIKPLGEGERRTALSNVIANFLLQLETAAPMLKDGLARVEKLFDGALDTSITIADKIAKVFESLSSAIKAGIEMTTAEDWDLETLLTMIDELALASSAVGTIPAPVLGPPNPAESKALAAEGGANGIHDAIVEGMKDSVLHIVLELEDDRRERRDLFMRLGQMETLVTQLVTKMDAA